MISGKYYRSIFLYSLVGVIAVGVVIAFAGIVPLYMNQKKLRTEALFSVLRAKTTSVEQYLTRARDISLQITSRSAIRDYLELYNRQEVGLKELVSFTAPKLMDAMSLSKEIGGISRLDRSGRLVVQVGLRIPEEHRPIPEKGATTPQCNGVITLQNEIYLVVGAPIINREGVRVGTDLILFNASALQNIITDYADLGETGETIIAVSDDSEIRPVSPARRYRRVPENSIRRDSPVGSAIAMSIEGKTGILHPTEAERSVIVYGPVAGNGFGIVAAMDKGEFNAPILRTAGRFAGLSAVLIAIGVASMMLAIRPPIRALRESESRFRQFFENEPEYCYMIAPDGLVLDVNKAALDVLGYRKEEVVGSPVQMIYAPGALRKVKENLQEWQTTGKLSNIEMVIRTKSGEERTVLLSAGSVKDAHGMAIHTISVQRDITERKKAEEEIRVVNAEILAINRIILACTGTLNIKEILDKVLDEALQITGLEGGTICMVTPENTLHLAAHRATSETTIVDLTTNEIKVGECLCGECAKDHKPLILPDREAVLKFATREATRGEDIRFHAAFPLIIGDKCLGVLCVFTRTDMKPPDRSLKILETISAQIALAVHNAQLYEETLHYSATLEDQVKERTKELDSRNTELERFNRLFVDREFRIKELKERVKELEKGK